MSFSARVLSLVIGVAIAAAGFATFLAFGAASTHLANSTEANSRNLATITRGLSEDALKSGTWDRAPQVAALLAASTDRRIRITATSGAVIADTEPDTAVPAGAPIRVDPKPQLTFIAGQGNQSKAVTMLEIRAFRSGARYSACLTRANLPVQLIPGPSGVPRMGLAVGASADSPGATKCRLTATESPEEASRDVDAIYGCPDRVAGGEAGAEACLSRVFGERVADVTADPVLLYVGPRAGSTAVMATPVVIAVIAVLAIAAGGTMLLSRRLLRSIDTLTSASRQLAEGDLGYRVPERGGDPVAAMSRSFNEMAKALQRSEERQRKMVANVAHELRTPLSNMRAYLEGLSDGVILPEPQLFASLQEEALLQQRIIDDLRRNSTADSTTLTYHKAELDLAVLVQACRLAQLPAAQVAGITLTATTSGPVPVYGDPDRLRQVIANMVSNALRYTPREGRVEIRAWHDGDQASIQVSDTGTGIAEEDLPKVFDRLWRADSARSRVADGLGLGLSIARQITVDHGGRIFVDSRLGIGTTFTVLLPLLVAREPAAVPAAKLAHVPRHGYSSAETSW